MLRLVCGNGRPLCMQHSGGVDSTSVHNTCVIVLASSIFVDS